MNFVHVSRHHSDYLHYVHLKAYAMVPHFYTAVHHHVEVGKSKEDEYRNAEIVIEHGLDMKNDWAVLKAAS